jgi:hypothetical protein
MGTPKMPSPQDDDQILLRFMRATLLALLAIVALAITVAMFWRDVGITSSIFDLWFGEWSEPQLTAVAGTVDLALWGAVRMTQRSEARYRQRSSSR